MATASETTDAFLSVRKANPDIERERRSASFNAKELIHIVDGGPEKTKRRKELESLLFNEPVFRNVDRYLMNRDETYEQAVEKSVKLFEWSRKYRWSEEDFEVAERLSNHDIAMALQHTMFIPAIERLANDEQREDWLPRAKHFEFIGTYAQTELGHGTNIMELETTATFDPSTDEFIMNSPTVSSMKWWPGALGKSSNMAIVLAQLIIKGKKFGLHPFLVPLRSVNDHTPLPGIQVGDIGPKMGLNNIDNGYLIMKDVRIPRKNMFMRNAEVTQNGQFFSYGVDKANYATMVLVRVKLVKVAYDSLAAASTIAIRYSAVRRQSSLKPGSGELQVLDYQSQQYKVIPAMAAAYAFLLSYKSLLKYYRQAHSDIIAGNAHLMAELHCQTSALKAYTTDVAVRLAEICRQACGGHGYLLSAGIGLLCDASLPLVTVEGENSVLYQQVARYLVKQVAKVVMGEPVADCVTYLQHRSYGDQPDVMIHSATDSYGDQPDVMIHSATDCYNLDTLLLLYQRMAYSVVTGAAKELQMDMEQGQEQHVAWNNNMVNLIRAAKTHAQLHIVMAFSDAVKELSKVSSSGVGAVLNAVCKFYILHGIVTEAADFMATQTITPSELKLIRTAELNVMANLRQDAVALVDAFDLHDLCLHSCLGCYDGNVYERLFSMAQASSLNKNQIHPAYYKHMKALIHEGRQQARQQAKL